MCARDDGLIDVYRQDYDHQKGKEAVYQCDHPAPEKPPECRHARFLLFKFWYTPSQRLSPYGEIAYNYAEMCLDDASVREGQPPTRRFNPLNHALQAL